MAKLRLAVALIAILLLCAPSKSVDVMRQFNVSDYSLRWGSVLSGTISDTNETDGASFRILEGAYSPYGMAAYQVTTARTTTTYSRWLESGWSNAFQASIPGASPGTVQFVVLKSNPIEDEKILVTLDSNSDIDAQVWNGSEWSATTEMTAAASIATKRDFDVAYEKISGRAIVAFSNATTATVTYRIWDGDQFLPNVMVGIGTAGVTNRIINLIPRPNSNEMMMLVSEGTAIPKLYGIFWNGTDFNASTLFKISDSLNGTSDEESYSGAWEEVSGDFNVYYNNNSRAVTSLLMRTFSGGVWGAEVQGGDGGNGDIRYVKAATFPGTDRQMVCWAEVGVGDLNCQTFTGTAFGARFGDDAIESVVGRNFDVAPLLNTDGGFVVMYGDSNDDWFDFIVCTSAANCDAATISTRALWSTTQLNGTDTRWGQLYADPYNLGNFTLIGLSQTAAGGWRRARIFCNAAACSVAEPWTGLNSTTSAVYESACFTYDQHRFYRAEAWHNSTQTADAIPPAKVINYVNVTARVNASKSANYSLSIYDWAGSSWAVCSEQPLVESEFSFLMCNITSSPGNYRSQDENRFVRIALNGPYNHSSQAVLEEDFLQFYVSTEDVPPFYDIAADNLGATNSTPMPLQEIAFYSLWYDGISLSAHWLEHNGSGAFQNEEALEFLAANNSWGNHSFIVPAAMEGKEFNARIWANDTSNQLNYTTNITIAVQNVVPAVGNTTMNATTALVGGLVCVNASATDVGVGVQSVWAMITYPNTTIANITLSDEGCNAGGAGDGMFGELIDVSSVKGNLTVNTTFANDSLGNMNSEAPYPGLTVIVSLIPNPIGGSNFYVGFYGNSEAKVINSTAGNSKIYETEIKSGNMFVVRSGAEISWDKVKYAKNHTDMTYMDAALNLTLQEDRLETYFNTNIVSTYTSAKGMLAFQSTAAPTIAQYQTWNGSEWSATAAASVPPVTPGTINFMVVKANPTRDEKILVTLDSGGDVDAQVWNGSEWSATTEMTAAASIATKRDFDVAYEKISGRAIVAFSNATTATVTYRIWDGDQFLPNVMVGIGTAGVTNRIINLIPRPNSNEMMMLVSEGTAIPKLYGIFWNGTDFNASTLFKISDSLNGTSDDESYSGAWEEVSGEFNVFYNNNSRAVTSLLMRTFSGGVWGDEVQGGDGGEGDIRYVKAASFPGTDRQMVCWAEVGVGDLNCQTYDGTNFGTRFSNDSIESVAGRNFDVAPLLGTDGGFFIMYGYLNADRYDFTTCSSFSDCAAGTRKNWQFWNTVQLGGTDTRLAQAYADPNNFGNLTLLGTSQTAASGWYRARLYCDASTCIVVEPFTQLAPTTSVVYEGAFFAFDAHNAFSGLTSPACGINNTYYLTSSDGNFRTGVLYSDENSNAVYDLGDNIIFCTDFNVNKENFEGGISDYEIVFPKSFAETVDMYFDA